MKTETHCIGRISSVALWCLLTQHIAILRTIHLWVIWVVFLYYIFFLN